MPTIRLGRRTTLSPAQFVAGLTTFGGSAGVASTVDSSSTTVVHRQGRKEADVTERSGRVWERLHYDWSDPNKVSVTTVDSNVFGGCSGYVYSLTSEPDGTTYVTVDVTREGRNMKGRILCWILSTIGRGVVRELFGRSILEIEAAHSSGAARAGRVN